MKPIVANIKTYIIRWAYRSVFDGECRLRTKNSIKEKTIAKPPPLGTMERCIPLSLGKSKTLNFLRKYLTHAVNVKERVKNNKISA